MTPYSVFNWLSEFRITWLGLSRLRPTQDKKYPVVFVAIGSVIFAVVAALALRLLNALDVLALQALVGGPSKTLAPECYTMIARLGFLLGLMFYGACYFAWNQRATRIRENLIVAGSPPPQLLARGLLGPVYFFVFCIIPAVALWCGIENIQGALRWNRLYRDLIAQGEKLDIKDVIPPQVPDAQNFAATPLFAELLKSASANSGDVPSAALSNAIQKFAIFSLPEATLPKRANDDTTPPALDEWVVAFEKVRTASATNKAQRANHPNYPQAPAGSDAATQILTALSIADDALAVICRDSQRPFARFPERWIDGFEVRLPLLSQFKSLQRHLNLRIATHLAKGDRTGAWDDLQCSLRLADGLREEPLVISQLVRIAQLHVANEGFWRGIAAHAWTDDQLQTLQRRFETMDVIGFVPFALEGERALANQMMNHWITHGVGSPSVGQPGRSPGGFMARISGFMGQGILRANQAAIIQMETDVIRNGRKLVANRASLDWRAEAARFDESTTAGLSKPYSPREIMARMLTPAFAKFLTRAVRSQTLQTSAAIACSVEMHYLKRGRYPDTLDALVPEFLKAIPTDPMDLKPMRYRRTDSGSFIVWSVGDNGIDDGGVSRRITGKRSDKNPPIEIPDWVWPF